MIEIKAVCTIEEYEKQKAEEKQLSDDSSLNDDLEQESSEKSSQLNSAPVRCIETQEVYDCILDASKKTGYKPYNIARSVKNHGCCEGVHFVWANEEDYTWGVEDLPGEIWYDIPGYEGHYQVSNKHRVKSLARKCYWKKGTIERSVPEYLMNTEDRIPLHLDGVRKFYLLSELERMAFPGKKRLFKFDI